MIEEYLPPKKRHDKFFERFLAQQIGTKNIPIEPLIEDSIPFPIEPIPIAPTVTSQKRVSTTSSDSRVCSPQVFSPISPLTPQHLPQQLQQTFNDQSSTSAVTKPFTLIHFLENSWHAKWKETKHYRSQPSEPNSQSVLRILTHQGYKLWLSTNCRLHDTQLNPLSKFNSSFFAKTS